MNIQVITISTIDDKNPLSIQAGTSRYWDPRNYKTQKPV